MVLIVSQLIRFNPLNPCAVDVAVVVALPSILKPPAMVEEALTNNPVKVPVEVGFKV